MPALTLTQVRATPALVAFNGETADGAAYTLRLLGADDARLLGDFFLGLSATTRSFFAPHAFDRETAATLCREAAVPAPGATLRFIAVTANGTAGGVFGYFLLQPSARPHTVERYRRYRIELDAARDCEVAPSLADAWQSRGVGRPLFGHVLAVAARLGFARAILMGGVQGRNERARRFYTALGFRFAGSFFAQVDNHDMFLPLPPTA